MVTHTRGLKHRLQRWFEHFLFFLLCKRYFLQRKRLFRKHPDTIFSIYNDPNISWERYIKNELRIIRDSRTMEAWVKQEIAIQIEQWERVVIRTWPENSTRLCPVCKNRVITVHTVRYKSPAGRLSRVVKCVALCSVCNNEIEHRSEFKYGCVLEPYPPLIRHDLDFVQAEPI